MTSAATGAGAPSRDSRFSTGCGSFKPSGLQSQHFTPILPYTVLASALNVRAFDIGRQPLRVVVDGGLRLPATAKMLRLPGATLIVTAHDDAVAASHLVEAGAEVLLLPAESGRVDLVALMQHLAAREINELMVEAGPGLCGALLAAQLLDEVVIYYAPHILGSTAQGMFTLPGLENMQQRVALQIQDVRAVGDDWRVTARVVT